MKWVDISRILCKLITSLVHIFELYIRSLYTMSKHPTLKVGGKIMKKRNVMKKFERVNVLLEDKRWKEGDKVLNKLPKTKVIV